MWTLDLPKPAAGRFLACRNYVLTTGTTNASRIVRAMGIGFNEVMTHLERMEREKIISSADASGRRTLLRMARLTTGDETAGLDPKAQLGPRS